MVLSVIPKWWCIVSLMIYDQVPQLSKFYKICVSSSDFTISLRNLDKHIQPSKNVHFLEEKPEALQKRLQEEYGTREGDFYKKLYDTCLEIVKLRNGDLKRVLDVGCACGRLTFDLSNVFKEVKHKGLILQH